LRVVKELRQVIVVTHNANIAVLGNAELIVPFKVGSHHGVVRELGSIDTPSTKRLACEILEGSEEAFKKRKAVYGL
jgi:DNA repair ATPase RecN